ncbi:MAG: 3-oxoacyl-[acyl-carrier-protein] reductase [Bacteroidia bacterium]|nr:3-oxoacyl-[acyl-carrier-protein] reductase [Bacteroidia bacterium]MDW8302570.1 3-oxoacyl-[acyl-carrier-protein] reductase [Bacteroidia bacterium]
MKLLQDKVALITGGTRGIGRAIVLKFAAQGAHVVFTYRSSVQHAESLVQEVQAMGVQALSFQSDATNTAMAEKVVEETLQKFGKLDILVNNAGITRDTLLMRMKESDWDEVLDTNLKSVFNFTKAAIKPMIKQKEGVIINISSVIGIMGNAGQANYAASKAGIIGFSKSVAKELASRNIRCNVIAPGWVKTEMTEHLPQNVLDQMLKMIPLARPAEPEEIADCAVFLASDMAKYITAQVICVDGGMVS